MKFFLMVCRTGSIRSAAKQLEVNHATVSRRINKFEASLGQRLFERSSKGYVCTNFGDEIFKEAFHIENRLNAISLKVAGKDETFTGDIRVTMPDLLAQDLLMAGFAEFCRLYPKIQLEIIGSAETFNLTSREADVAFRLCDFPPDYLIGRKLAVMHRACYMSRKLLPMLEQEGWLERQNWIGWTDKLRKPVGKIAREYPRFESKHKIISSEIQANASKHAMGIAILPCFYGDKDENLVRVPPYTSEGKYKLWILSHPEMRKNTKVNMFIKFMSKHILSQRALLEGEEYINRSF